MSKSVIAEMYISGNYSDATIICQGQTFNIHRCIVCPQSKPLAAALDGGFKEGLARSIELEDEEAEIVDRMLEFMYTSDFSDENSKASDATIDTIAERALLIDAKVYVTAEKYDIRSLKRLAKEKYENRLPGGCDSDFFIDSLKLIYGQLPESDEELKDIAIQAAGLHVHTLINREEFVSLCKENGEIGFDIFKAALTCNPCPRCHDTRYVRENTYDNFEYPCRDDRWKCVSCNFYWN